MDYKDYKDLKVAWAVMLGAPTNSYVQELRDTQYDGCPEVGAYQKLTEQAIDCTDLSISRCYGFL